MLQMRPNGSTPGPSVDQRNGVLKIYKLKYAARIMNRSLESIGKLYSLMEEMLLATKEDNNDKVSKLNQELSSLITHLYDSQSDLIPLLKKYDTCRNACCTAVGIFHDDYSEWAELSQERFNDIPKPRPVGERPDQEPLNRTGF